MSYVYSHPKVHRLGVLEIIYWGSFKDPVLSTPEGPGA